MPEPENPAAALAWKIVEQTQTFAAQMKAQAEAAARQNGIIADAYQSGKWPGWPEPPKDINLEDRAIVQRYFTDEKFREKVRALAKEQPAPSPGFPNV